MLVSSVNHWTGEQNQGQVSAVDWGQEGCSRGTPRGSCLQPPFITSQLAPASPLPDRGIQPEQQPSGRGLASAASPSAIAAALARAIEMQDRLGSSDTAGASSCTQDLPH